MLKFQIFLARTKAMASKGKRKIEAIGYMRTSSATNVGRDKDSEVRQRVAIESYAKAAGYTIVDWFYDPAVKGTDAVTDRPDLLLAHLYAGRREARGVQAGRTAEGNTRQMASYTGERWAGPHPGA